ncbi:MAG: integrating conjugative element protein [Methylothermaceae bacterium]|nr:integrating conjugative element protein [Methylothermaceae bacterium]
MRIDLRLFTVPLLACLIGPPTVADEPAVLLDDGGEPLPYSIPSSASLPSPARPPNPNPNLDDRLFPVHTSNMTPGAVKGRRLRFPNGWRGRPLFVVGDDPRSLRWLKRHYRRLAELGAGGLVTEVESMDRFLALARAFPALRLTPAPADMIAETYGLRHYPVLISREFVEQ